MDELLEIRKKYSKSKQIVEEIYLTVREGIIKNVYESGERLTEEELSNIFGVSRTPAREVIKRLECEGMVTYSAKFGYQVRVFTPEESIEILEMLEYMDQIATRAAAKRISTSNLMLLMDNIDKTRNAKEQKDFFKLLNEFHVIIAKSINNHQFYTMYQSLYLKFVCISNRIPYAHIQPEDAIQSHMEIYEALSQHDEDRAWQLSLEHSNVTLQSRVKRLLQ